MTRETSKKKPIKLEWEGGILQSTQENPVLINKHEVKQKNSPAEPKKISGRVVLRTEKKGRAGNPVSILTQFSDPEAKNKASLQQLCSELKTKLACGGTIENGEIILMIRDLEKLKNVLLNTFNISS